MTFPWVFTPEMEVERDINTDNYHKAMDKIITESDIEDCYDEVMEELLVYMRNRKKRRKRKREKETKREEKEKRIKK